MGVLNEFQKEEGINMKNIEYPWISQFIANHKSSNDNRTSTSIMYSIKLDRDLRWELGTAFGWSDTKEGHAYWLAIASET